MRLALASTGRRSGAFLKGRLKMAGVGGRGALGRIAFQKSENPEPECRNYEDEPAKFNYPAA